MLATQVHELVRDLHAPNPRTYWTDLLLTAAVGWGAFAVAVLFRTWSWPWFLALFVSVCALYRGLCFLHEITHLRAAMLRRFEFAWNIVFGIPLLLPSFMYVGVHQYHHGLSTYGTERDPEYLPFAGKRLMITVFIIQGLLIPLMLFVRFFVIFPVSLVSPPVRRWLSVHFSALCLNAKFRRDDSSPVRRSILRWELATVMSWIAVAAAVALFSRLGWRYLVTWYVALASVAVLNIIRTLGAHRYTSDGRPLGRDQQLIDSIDTPGAFWTELWAPVGLRYHALHHYFPGIPYHNLGAAYRRLSQNLPGDAVYHQTGSRSLPYSLRTLYSGEWQKRHTD
jgi:fatty acid desaturase